MAGSNASMAEKAGKPKKANSNWESDVTQKEPGSSTNDSTTNNDKVDELGESGE
jgi:hypothetical protein